MKNYYVVRLLLAAILMASHIWLTAQTVTLPPRFREEKEREYNSMQDPEVSFDDYYRAAVADYERIVLKPVYRPGSVMHSPCGNGNFEPNLDTTEWQGGNGMVSTAGVILYSGFTNGILSGLYNSSSAHQTPVSAGLDEVLAASSPSISMSRVAPGGSTQAMRIGNAAAGNGAELLSKSYVVTQANALTSFWYALVLQDPNHAVAEKPAFRVRVINNSTGQEISGVADLGGGSNVAIADANNPFFQKTSYKSQTLVYRSWSCAQINLSAYVGTSVTVQFVTNDCAQGAHFGYAYIDNFCGTCNTPDNPSGGFGIDEDNSSSCGRGKLCFTYNLPRSGTTTGSVTITLRLYQNGVQVAQLVSPTLTSQKSYCFGIDPAAISGLNTSLAGMDFMATAAFTINNTSLASQSIGTAPQGQLAGTNNDYLFRCPPQCCPGKNVIRNGSFEQGNAYVTSDYSYEAVAGLNTVSPGEYGILTSAQAQLVSSGGWNPACPGYNYHLVVNGATGQSGQRLVWSQTTTIEKGKTYKFCADFKNLPACAFDVKPRVSVQFSYPGQDINNVTINIGNTGCAWQKIEQNILVPGSGAYSLTVRILLDETGLGDGNDLAIDNIGLIAIPQVPANEVLFNLAFQNTTATTTGIAATPVVPLGSGCHFYWQVEEIDANNQVVPGTQVLNASQWWTMPNTNTFNGYNGTGTLSGTAPGVFQLSKRYRITYGRWCDCAAWNSRTVIFQPLTKSTGDSAVYEDSTYLLSDEQILRIINGDKPGDTVPGTGQQQRRAAPGREEPSGGKVFPNPTENKVTVLLPETEEASELELRSISGQLLQTIHLQSGASRAELSLAGQPAGLYMLRVVTRQGRVLLHEKVTRL